MPESASGASQGGQPPEGEERGAEGEHFDGSLQGAGTTQCQVRKRSTAVEPEVGGGACSGACSGAGNGGGSVGDGASEGGLLRWSDMPPHLQFNPYVLGGYRPLLSFWGSVASLFYFHNETINILTHGIPILYILVTVPRLLPWERLDSWFLPWCHVVGAISPWIGSFLYHLFMNTRCGEPVYRRLLQLDMLGIWISQSFGAMPMVSASVYCLSWGWRSTLLSAYSILSLWGLYKALTAWSPWERRLCFALPFCMRAFLCCLRSSGLGGGDPSAMVHVVLQDAVSAVGGAIGAMHVPEKWMPGRVDLILNSHNIMHLLVVSAVYCMHHATVRDLLWMSSASPCGVGSGPSPPPLTPPLASGPLGDALGRASEL
ncbi:progestin and adipoQ receptor family member 4 [Ischnura elegans]|uniref:progestin and adipoQ receptor family member 4 n=1 Tax=Ischnura elegans TaxID=197161 RepID=UPI001ED8935D|nr:progestin and adipoQ receptor family member 4 [Ischnura elegans]